MRHLDVGLDLLDRHIVDCDGDSLGKVDDVEVEFPPASPPRITALLLGPQAQGGRIGGRIGRWMTSIGTRLAGSQEPYRIPVGLVEDFGVSIRLTVAIGDLPEFHRLERWLADHFTGRIPGGHRASG